MLKPLHALAALSALVLAACGDGAPPGDVVDAARPEGPGEVNVYTSRHYDSDRALYDAFTEATGIKVNYREAGAPQLLETMKAEGEASPADVLITSDAGAIWRFQDAGLLQAATSEPLVAAIPARYRDPDNLWFGLSKRFRVIVYDPEAVSPDQVDEYADLADPALAGEVCARTSSNVYNLSLLGDLMERLGPEDAEAWAAGVAGNFARDPQGGDTAQIEAVAAGACSVALSNHYYWVRLAESGSASAREAAEATAVSFPRAGGQGAHVNVTGAGVAAYAPNYKNAVAFIEFLATPEGQSLLTTETKEFPIVPGAAQPAGLERLETPLEGSTPLSAYGRNQAEAQAAYDRAGWR